MAKKRNSRPPSEFVDAEFAPAKPKKGEQFVVLVTVTGHPGVEWAKAGVKVAVEHSLAKHSGWAKVRVNRVDRQ